MNLASRCREAISHVAMLKKELSMHQRRAAEALAMQRQQSKMMMGASDEVDNSNGMGGSVNQSAVSATAMTSTPPPRLRSSSAVDVAAEMDKVDRILASHAAPSPRPFRGEESVNYASPSTTVTEESRAPGLSPDEKKMPTTSAWNQQQQRSPAISEALDTDEIESSPTPLDFRKELSSQPHQPRADSSHLSSDFFANFGETSIPANDNSTSLNNRFDDVARPVSTYSISPGGSPNKSVNDITDKQRDRSSVVKKTSIEDVPADELMSDNGRPTETTFFPYSASPTDHKNSYNEGFPGDIQARKHSFSSERKKHVGGIMELDEEYTTPSTTPVDESIANKKLNSIDAFEASFDATFPAAFSSPKDETKKERVGTSTEIYNPFFPGSRPPRRDSGAGADKPWGNQLRDRSAAATTHNSSPGHSTQNSTSSHSGLQRRGNPGLGLASPGAVKPQIPTAGNKGSPSVLRRLSPSQRGILDGSSSPESSHEESKYDTDSYKTPLIDFSHDSDEPKRPEKQGAAAARARYEKALQPRLFGTSARKNGTLKEDSDHSTRSSEHSTHSLSIDTSADHDSSSTSLMLKRLQQRKVKERLAAASEASVTLSSTSNGSSRSLSSGSRLAHKQTWPGSSPYDEDDDGSMRRPELLRGSSDAELSRSSTNKPPFNVGANRAQPDQSLLGNLSPGSVRAEILALDALASGSYHGTGHTSPTSSDRFALAGKLRRNVKQPVSYTEPSLNSKLRRGDVYFPKTDDRRSSPVFHNGDDDHTGRQPLHADTSSPTHSEAALGLTSSTSSVRS